MTFPVQSDGMRKSTAMGLYVTCAGTGSGLHEAPEIPNYEVKRKGVRLKAGMTLAIEPMINIGGWEVEWLDDDWTVVTRDRSLSAHYENTVLITEGGPRLLTYGRV